MKFGSMGAIRCAVVTMIVCLFGITSARGQNQPATDQKPQMAENAFKNVQVLRGISVDEFMGTMGFFAASLSMNCTDCHTADSAGSWAAYADDTPLKQRARMMVVMMNSINKANFGGQPGVTCYTCHRGSQHPEITPSLAEQYGPPPVQDPDQVQTLKSAPKQPTVDQILDKYIQALGGAQQVAKLTSFVAKGTYTGFDTDFSKLPIDIYAQAPGLRTMVVHTLGGDDTTTYTGSEAWVASVDKPVPLMPLTGGDLEGARADADLSFPALIKQNFTNLHAGFPPVMIDNRTDVVIEGTTSGGAPIKLYFDNETGLLVRQVRYNKTIIGLDPTHIEYSDYRLVSGVKVPFHWTVTWVDGQSTTDLSSFRANVPIDAARFAKPAPATPKDTKAAR